MRTPTPRPGRSLPFLDWARILVREVRAVLPGVRATRAGHAVFLRLDGNEVTLRDVDGVYRVQQTGAIGSGLVDADRHDDFTAATMGASVVGMLDPRLCTSEALAAARSRARNESGRAKQST